MRIAVNAKAAAKLTGDPVRIAAAESQLAGALVVYGGSLAFSGSPVINKLQSSSLSEFDQFVRYLVVNEVMNFTNADGTPCKVDIDDQGFTDLASGSAALSALNTDAANHHPEETYRTFGGNDPGFEYDLADALLDVYPDDGLVFLTSANPTNLIGQVESTVVPQSHSSIVTEESSLLKILDALLGN